MFLYHASEEGDDVIGWFEFDKAVQNSVKKISTNIKAVLLAQVFT